MTALARTVVAQFTVPGEPAVKHRHRINTHTRRAYSTKAMQAAEANIGWRYRQAAGPGAPSSDGLFGLVLRFHCGKGSLQDLDNAIKIVCDALNKITYADDRQVVRIDAELWRNNPNPRTEITVYRIERTG